MFSNSPYTRIRRWFPWVSNSHKKVRTRSNIVQPKKTHVPRTMYQEQQCSRKKIPHIPWYVPGATVFHGKKSPRSTMYRYVPCTRATVFHRKKPTYQKQQLFSFCQHIFFHVSRPQHCGEKKVNRRLHRMKKKAKIAGPICYYARNQPQEDKGPAQRYQSSQIGAVPRTGVLGGTRLGTGWAGLGVWL
jgi:hypothetical protein